MSEAGGSMIIVGLTGGVASGKSTVARMLEGKGALVLDADRIAREVVLPGEEAWRELRDWLGPSIAGPQGDLDRRRLGELVFNDPIARQRLNAIVHPRVFEVFAARTAEIRRRDPDAVLIYDVPLLLETGMEGLVDLVVLVYVPAGIQLQRLQSRDDLTPEAALSRIGAQISLEEKRALADTIIDNSGTRDETLHRVAHLWGELQARLRAAGG